MRHLAIALALGLVIVSGANARSASFDPDPVFPVGPISDTTSHQIAKLDRIASRLAGRRTTVNCWSLRDWTRLDSWRGTHHYPRAMGITYPDDHQIDLSPFICEVLGQALARSANQPLFTAYAVTVLAHESAHASGISAENQAECRAIQTDTRAARLLGLPSALAMRIPHIYRGTIYPYDEQRYRTPVCHPGLPGVVVPDTLGPTAELRPFERIAAAAAQSLRGWKNDGGADAV